jgi:phosphatidyl-myo-inositol alpha-mannosyltransferase
MKIAYVLDDTLDKADGVQQCVVAIGEYMRGLGHEVHYLVAESVRTDLKNIHPIARYVSMKFNGNSVRTPRPTSTKLIRRTLQEIKPDVIHIQMPYSPFFGSRVLSCAEERVKIVGTWHTFPTGGLQRLSHYPLYWMIKKTIKKVSTTIGVSLPTAKFADSVYQTKSIVIPNAVPLARFIDASSIKTSTRKHIVFLGRFDTRKGPKLLIEALNELRRGGFDMSGVDITMGGKGPDLAECKQLATRYGLDINFTGFIDEQDKPSLLASADITVFPSTGGEAFGISVVEAMASGASIVLGGNNPGYRSILGHKPELLFDPTDTPAFARKLAHYINLSPKEAEVKKTWLKKSAEQYDVVLVCKQLLEIYTT